MSRLVDKLPPPTQIRPMKVVGLGASRTGTLGLTAALKTLGLHPFHISELLPYGIEEMRVLGEAIRASNSDSPFTRADFDRMWGQYDCIIESPCYLGSASIETYLEDPNIKFLLTDRTPSSFAKSLRGSLIAYHIKLNQFPLCITRYLDPFVWELDAMFRLMTNRWTGGLDPSSDRVQKVLEEAYVAYTNEVKLLVPPERLLILDLEKGFGFDEICTFLEIEKPEEMYPRSNTMAEFHVAAEMVLAPSVERTWRILGGSVLAAVGLGAVWWLRYIRAT